MSGGQAPRLAELLIHSREANIASRLLSAQENVVLVPRDYDGNVSVNAHTSLQNIDSAITQLSGLKLADLLCLAADDAGWRHQRVVIEINLAEKNGIAAAKSVGAPIIRRQDLSLGN